MAEKLKFVLGGVEIIVGKGENAGYQQFVLFPQCFQKGFYFSIFQSQDRVVNETQGQIKQSWSHFSCFFPSH